MATGQTWGQLPFSITLTVHWKQSITISFGQLQLLSIDIFIFIVCLNWVLPIRNALFWDIKYGFQCSISLNILNTGNKLGKIHLLRTDCIKSNWNVIEKYFNFNRQVIDNYSYNYVFVKHSITITLIDNCNDLQ